MIEEFCSYFEGYFNNQMQAFNYPREFAMIELNHRRIEGTNRFTVTQGYVMDGDPYRSVEIEVIDDSKNNQVILKTYKDDEHIPGCDCVFQKVDNEFHGDITGKECFVQRGIKNTYMQSSAKLGDGYYHVIDQGFDPDNDEQLWGSRHGHFEFDRK
jgi:hypothetical protein